MLSSSERNKSLPSHNHNETLEFCGLPLNYRYRCYSYVLNVLTNYTLLNIRRKLFICAQEAIHFYLLVVTLCQFFYILDLLNNITDKLTCHFIAKVIEEKYAKIKACLKLIGFLKTMILLSLFIWTYRSASMKLEVLHIVLQPSKRDLLQLHHYEPLIDDPIQQVFWSENLHSQ